jgi:Ran-binding protein 1
MAEHEEEVVDENYDPEKEVDGSWKVVDLPEIPVITGEEEDAQVHSVRTKLYRFVDKQWKERGIGEFKLLKSKANGKIRAILRQEKTHKIFANFYCKHFLIPTLASGCIGNKQ